MIEQSATHTVISPAVQSIQEELPRAPHFSRSDDRAGSPIDILDIPFADRVLLLPHCLRPSQDCPGKMTKQGLDCTGCTLTDCAIYQLRSAATEVGYGGICVAPGGRLAVRFLDERQPAGVVAVACQKELDEGLEAVGQMDWVNGRPTVVAVPLSQDGCVDTMVDVKMARAIVVSHNGHKK